MIDYKAKFEEAMYALMVLLENDHWHLDDEAEKLHDSIYESEDFNDNTMTSWENPWVDQLDKGITLIKNVRLGYINILGTDEYNNRVNEIKDCFAEKYFASVKRDPPPKWITDLRLDDKVYIRRYNRSNWIPAKVVVKAETLLEVASLVDNKRFGFDYYGKQVAGAEIGRIELEPYREEN